MLLDLTTPSLRPAPCVPTAAAACACGPFSCPPIASVIRLLWPTPAKPDNDSSENRAFQRRLCQLPRQSCVCSIDAAQSLPPYLDLIDPVNGVLSVFKPFIDSVQTPRPLLPLNS